MKLPNPYDPAIDVAIALSALLFVISLLWAYRLRTAARRGALTEEGARVRGYILIGLWVILPPIWFFFEFQCLHPNMVDDPFELSRVRHAQDLARNIWLSFVVVLAAVVGVKWPPS